MRSLERAAVAFASCRPGPEDQRKSTERLLVIAALRYGQAVLRASLPTRGDHLALLDADERFAGRLPWR